MSNASYLLQNAPGLFGDIARHIHDGLAAEQPSIALGASLALCGALYSGRLVSATGVQPCIYAGVVAESGSGKSQAQSAIKELVEIAELERLEDFLMGRPASDSGLLTALSRANRRLLIWDEFGIAISALSNSKQSHEAMILSQIMELYSEAGKKVKGKEYSTKDRIDLNGAYLSILGASTPNRFFQSLNIDFVQDGFLPRWFLFFSEPYKKKAAKRDDEAFAKIVLQMQDVQEWKAPAGNLSRVSSQRSLEVLDCFDGANAGVKTSITAWRYHVQDKREEGSDLERLFYSRAEEMYQKVMLCIRPAQIDYETTHYVQDFVESLLDRAIAECESRVFQGSRTRELNSVRAKIIALIKPGECVTRSRICRASQHWCSPRDRQEILASLVEDGTFQETITFCDNSRKKSTSYIRQA